MRRRFLIASLVVLCLALTQISAVAGTWMNENFDSYNLGPLNGQGSWSGNSTPIQVEQSFFVSGKAIEANYRTWGAGEVGKNVNSGGGYHTIDMDVAMDITRGSTGYEGSNLGKIYIRDTTSLEITRVYLSDNQIKVRLGNSIPVILTPVPNDTWIHIRIGINLTTSLMDVWVNGSLVVSQQPTVTPASSIGSISFGQWNGAPFFSKSETYMDNLLCTGSMALGSSYRIISPSESPGWERYNVCYPYAFYDTSASQYKMYYSGSGTCQINESLWDQWMIGLGTSSDGIVWSRNEYDYEPVLYSRKFYEGDLVDPDEQAAIFDSVFAVGACVIKDGSTYKMWYTGWNGESEHIGGGIENKINYRIGYATSTDGKVWTKYTGSAGANSIFGLGAAGSQDAKGVGQPFVLKEGSTYRMWYEGFDGSLWRIFYATSSDGINWTRQGTALNPGGSGALDQQGTRNPVVIFRNGQYELWYQGKSVSSPYYHVLRATSPNGITWTKVSGQITLNPVAPPQPDPDGPQWSANDPAAEIYVDSIIIQADGTCQLFYTKEITASVTKTYGTIKEKRLHIYTESISL
ncbi:MAG: hypothetical protein Q7N50_08830 [Armatimonadota bacterium]|nr:hypothetical protein [Armatimonadota bacterium]